MPALHTISQQLAYMTKPRSWEPIGDWTEAEITELRFEAANDLRQSLIGQQLYVRGGSDIFDRVLEEFGRRAHPPSVAPFYETLEQAARDVLLTLPAEADLIPAEPLPVVPTQEEIQREEDALATKRAQREDRLKYLEKFSYMANAAIEFSGVKCIKPVVGVVTLRFVQNGKEYKYEYSGSKLEQFRQDFEEACARGLIR